MAVAMEPELLTDHFSHWGLSYDPFDPDINRSVFFTGAQRGQIVSQIAHFCQFGSGVLVVESEEGAGRKTVLEQVSRQISEENLLKLDAATQSDPSQIFFQILERLEPDQPVASLGIGQVLAELRHLLQLDSAGTEHLVVSLVNPELLDDKVIAALVTLLQGAAEAEAPSIKLLFWSDSTLVERLDKLNLVDVPVCDLPIPAMSASEVEEYLVFLLKHAGAEKQLFTAAECETIWRQSKGLPGRVDAFARAALLRKLPDTLSQRRSSGMPVHYMMLLVLLVCALLMLLFYGFDRDSSEGQSLLEGATVTDAVSVVSVEPEEVTASLAPPAVAEKSVQQIAEVEAQTIATEMAPVPEVLESVVDAGAASHGGSESSFNTDLDVGVAQSPSVEPDSAEDDSASVVESGVVEGQISSPLEVEVAGVEVDAFFLAQPDSAYFLQVLAAGSIESVEAFIKRQANSENLNFYKGRRNGKDWYVVLSGPYQNSDEARAAIRLLPQEQQKLSPWPRSAKDVKSKIR
ncbi:MAG: SPOR domain-containing protein [Candidatus Pelagadaptatus aseana]|uniref:SPOR domain-containing protein n=1 Tax=Candidatus Pelagadaptatus aseana TaxID=3120508 RepID=UPI0039B1B702